jgi:hypothetical protein
MTFNVCRREAKSNDEKPLPIRVGAWYADPFATAAERWWDGHKWTEQVRGEASAGLAGRSHLGGDARL